MLFRCVSRGAAARALCLALVTATACVARAEEPFQFETTPGKLPKTVLPRAYRIDLRPDIALARFSATEEVDINVAVATSTVTLNALDLAFARVVDIAHPQDPARVSVDRDSQTATITLGTPLAVGLHTLRLEYAGHITAQPSGLYYNDYRSGRARKRMIVTQFESTDARRMFPGWDEPSFKATFSLSVVVPTGYVALSNTPVTAEESAGRDAHGTRMKKVSFATTPSMSTYLVALAAGELESVRERSADVTVAAWAVAGKARQGRQAVHDTLELLPYFNDYFGIDYPLPKLDLIAIPGNFDAGAMENWGAITFIDDALLFDPMSSSESTRRDIYATLAHELAHQWSGDLVTMAWWDNIWLNEGFAAWMETKAADHFRPQWHVWLNAHADKELAMASDARRFSHPIQAPVTNESEARTLFDDITYLKGAQLIRMLEAYVGEDAFRRGMQAYMKHHAYSNATTADLWAALGAASGQPIAAVAAGFTRQAGFPLIRVTSRCEAGQLHLLLSQHRFSIHDAQATAQAWQVPVRVGPIGARGPVRDILVDSTAQELAFAGCDTPVKVNLGDVGYYRVAYDAASLDHLRAALPAMAAADRVNLLSDQWALVVAGEGQAGDYLSLLEGLGEERELIVWQQAMDALLEIDRVLRGTDDRAAFRARAGALLLAPLARLGWEPQAGEPSDEVLLRGELIRTLGLLHDPTVLSTSRQRFERYLEHPASLDPSLLDAVTANVGQQADQATFKQLRRLGRAASGTEEKLRYYRALAQAPDPALLPQIMAIALTDEIAPARVATVLRTAAVNGPDPDGVWRAALRIQEPLRARLTEDQRERVLPHVAAPSMSVATADELLALPASQSSSGARYEAARIAEQIAGRAELRERLIPQVAAWLAGSSRPTS